MIFVVSCAEDKPAEPDNGGNGGNGEGNAVVVSSITVARGEQGVIIPVRLTNDVALRGVVLPLELRPIDAGAYVTSLKLSFGDRLPPDGVLGDLKFTNQSISEDGNCKSGQPGGFGTIFANDTLPHALDGPPVGLLFSRHRFIGADLPPGTDNTGSFLLTVDVSNIAGKFEIDSTCINPSNNLLLVDPDLKGIVPTFTKGTITIE
jgi:hypothetical protein